MRRLRVHAEEVLAALQNPPDCTTRGCSCGTEAKILRDGIRDDPGRPLPRRAAHSNRTMIWGPEALPRIFAGSECDEGRSSIASSPVSHCNWEQHVYREEVQRWLESAYGHGARLDDDTTPRALDVCAPEQLVGSLPEARRDPWRLPSAGRAP